MRILLLNQAFPPDVAATAQYLGDLARELSGRGHDVRVISSRRAYDEPARQFAARENWHGIDITRVWTTALGKSAKWKRACDFASFMVSCVARLVFTRTPDVIIALTSPPLISFVAACFARWRGCRFLYWIMDLNPDEALAAGWLRENSSAARVLESISRFSLRQADRVVVLDRFMQDRVRAKNIPHEKLTIIPPWSHDDHVRFDRAGRAAFRAEHGLTDQFVVMYSGNHSPCHPLTTLLEAARELAADDRIAFCFVGGGSGFARVKEFATAHQLLNIKCLSYQPLERLAGSLSAADVHVVVMGEPFVGTIHPCKIYNILSVGSPVLYIGPQESHIADIFPEANLPGACVRVGHGDVEAVVRALRSFAVHGARGTEHFKAVTERFAKKIRLAQFVAEIEALQKSA